MSTLKKIVESLKVGNNGSVDASHVAETLNSYKVKCHTNITTDMLVANGFVSGYDLDWARAEHMTHKYILEIDTTAYIAVCDNEDGTWSVTGDYLGEHIDKIEVNDLRTVADLEEVLDLVKVDVELKA